MTFNKDIPYNDLPLLAWRFDYNQIDFLKLAIKATGKLEKLNGLIYLIPNKHILISPLLIKESVESSAIENINTTTIKVLQSKALWWKLISWTEKEVLHYHDAILTWFEKLKKEWGIGYNFFVELQKIIEPSKPWIRTLPWTVIANSEWDVLYTPPTGKDSIQTLLSNMELFYDWNGRTWRIINILYLILSKKLDFPVLFLSEYINKTKDKYYSLLNKTHKTWDYSEFIVYFLEWIISQADKTSKKILRIQNLMKDIEQKIEKLNMNYHKITNLLFSEPYLSISSFEKHMSVKRITATRNIKKLEDNNIVSSVKVWRNKLIFIPEFIDLLS